MLYGRIIGVAAVAALVVMSVALVAGCGGGSEASADTTKAQFTKEAEAICAERKKDWDAEVAAYNKKISAESKKGGPAAEKEQAESLLSDSLVPILRTELEALEELDVPEADEAKVEKMLQSRSQGLEEIEDGGVEAFFDGPFKGFEKEAEAYGLDCSME